ncbi:hypothetical protein GCM10025791_46480 [Halioxenophilus aromaticivorans]|uniref:Uncharacterized protein n=1 Tax=Halioxenophilus aromaticivorans TaxID=1306992 RepID=A0AAV3U9Z7_9ALTE
MLAHLPSSASLTGAPFDSPWTYKLQLTSKHQSGLNVGSTVTQRARYPETMRQFPYDPSLM